MYFAMSRVLGVKLIGVSSDHGWDRWGCPRSNNHYKMSESNNPLGHDQRVHGSVLSCCGCTTLEPSAREMLTRHLPVVESGGSCGFGFVGFQSDDVSLSPRHDVELLVHLFAGDLLFDPVLPLVLFEHDFGRVVGLPFSLSSICVMDRDRVPEPSAVEHTDHLICFCYAHCSVLSICFAALCMA